MGHDVVHVASDPRPVLCGASPCLCLTAEPQLLGLFDQPLQEPVAGPDDPSGEPEPSDERDDEHEVVERVPRGQPGCPHHGGDEREDADQRAAKRRVRAERVSADDEAEEHPAALQVPQQQRPRHDHREDGEEGEQRGPTTQRQRKRDCEVEQEDLSVAVAVGTRQRPDHRHCSHGQRQGQVDEVLAPDLETGGHRQAPWCRAPSHRTTTRSTETSSPAMTREPVGVRVLT